jgi:hypothetical protein
LTAKQLPDKPSGRRPGSSIQFSYLIGHASKWPVWMSFYGHNKCDRCFKVEIVGDLLNRRFPFKFPVGYYAFSAFKVLEEIFITSDAGIDWVTESGIIGWAFPDYLTNNMTHFNWEEAGWILLRHRKDLFDSAKYDWSKHSFAIPLYAPELMDPLKYNWVEHSASIAMYAPQLIDLYYNLFNWNDISASRAVEKYCPEKLLLKPY